MNRSDAGHPDSAHEWNPDPERVARLAHSYYVERGYSHGSHEDDWHRAEAELRAEAQLKAGGGQFESERGGPASRTVIAVFPSMNDAARAYEELQQEAFSKDEVSMIANGAGTSDAESSAVQAGDVGSTQASEVGVDAGIGAALGGVGGLLLSLAALAVPGIGPVLATGPIIAALGGAGLGAAAGGLIGALTDKGVPEDRAANYAEGIRRGGTLVAVHASGDRADRAAEILDRNGAVDIDDRVSTWRQSGLSAVDPDPQPLTADEIRREQEYFRASQQQAEEWRRASRIY